MYNLSNTLISFYTILIKLCYNLLLTKKGVIMGKSRSELKKQIQKMLKEYYSKNYNSEPSSALLKRMKISKEDLFCSDSWTVGGRTGGNCWGDEANINIEAEAPKEIDILDSFLEREFPEISFLKYKKLMQKAMTEQFTVSEYYGNYTEYCMKYILVDDVLDFLEVN